MADVIDLTQFQGEDEPTGFSLPDILGLPEIPRFNSAGGALTAAGGSNESLPGSLAKSSAEGVATDPRTFGRGASAAAGGLISALANPFLAPVGATAGSQAWDAFSRSATGTEVPAAEVTKGAGKELLANSAIDLLTMGAGRLAKGTIGLVNKNFGNAALIARKAQSDAALPAMIGQGIQQTNVSEGGAKQLAKQVDHLIESNAILGKEFDPVTAKFVGDTGKESLEQMQKRLGGSTLKVIAETRDNFLGSLDREALRLNATPIQKEMLDTSVADEIIARLKLSSENAGTARNLENLKAEFLNDLEHGRTFKEAQKEIQNQYDKIRVLGSYDDKALAQVPPSQLAANQYERQVRTALADSLRKTVQQRADDLGDVVGIKAPSGEANSAYIDRLNDVYASTRTLHDDLSSFITRQIGGTGNRPAQSFVQTDVSKIDPRSPLTSSWRAMLGGPFERYRELGILNDLDTKIPEQLRAFARARGGEMPTISDGSGFIDPIRTGSMAALFALEAGANVPELKERRVGSVDSNALGERLTSLIGPQEAMTQIQQVQMAEDTHDPIVTRKAYGTLLQVNPELKKDFAQGHTMAQSEFDGVIADPMEKEAIRARLSSLVKSGEESSIAASKFVAMINGDKPFKRSDVPKSIRAPRSRAATEEVTDLGVFGNLGATDILPPQ